MSEHHGGAPPTLLSLLLCDQVIDDKLTNKKSAIGLFSTFVTTSLPAVIPQMAVLATLTEITRRCSTELRLVRDADNSVLFVARGNVEAPDPLSAVDLVFAMHGLRLPTAGQYAFEMIAGGEFLGRRRFHVVLRPPRPPAAPESAGPDASN